MSTASVEYNSARYDLALALADDGVVSLNHPLVLNFATPPLTPQAIEKAAGCLQGLRLYSIDVARFDAVVGMPRTGDLLAKAFAKLAGKVLVELGEWEHTGKWSVAGLKGSVPAEVEKVLLVNGSIANGDSEVQAISILQDEGIEVADVAALVDLEQGGPEQLDEWRCRFHSVFTLTLLADLYVDIGRMPARTFADIG